MIIILSKNIYNYKKWKKKEKKEKADLKRLNFSYKIVNKLTTFLGMRNLKIKYNNLKTISKRIAVGFICSLILIYVSILVDNFACFFNFKTILTKHLLFNSEVFVDFLVSCIGTAGFLIALFYANLSGIFTSRYATISNRISNELLQEETNKKYIDAIMNYIIITLFLLLFNLIGLKTDITVSVIFLLLTMRIIIIFFDLSRRIFIYSDTVLIGENAAKNIYKAFDRIVVDSYKYDNKNVQHHNYQIVSFYIKTLDDLSNSLINDNDFDGMYSLLLINLGIISKYCSIKNKIPFSSAWFPNITKPKYWFKEDDIAIITAVETGTSLQPTFVKDKYFLEDKLLEINSKITNILLHSNEYEKINYYMDYYNQYFDAITLSGDYNYWFKKNESIISEIISSINYGNQSLDDNKYIVSLFDMISLSYVSICNGFSNYLDQSYNTLQNINWSNFDSVKILQKNNYIINNDDFNDFISKIQNEILIEKKMITTCDFCDNYLKVLFIQYMKDLFMYLSNSIEKLNKIAFKMNDLKLYKNAAIVYSRNIEIANKLYFRIDNAIHIYEKFKITNNNYNHIIIDFESMKKKIKADLVQSFNQFCDVVMILSEKKYDINEIQIDFVGEIYYHLTNFLLETIIDNDFDSFKPLYRKYAIICSISSELISKIIPTNSNTPYLISKYSMTTVSFMNISGFAIYYSHLNNDAKWEKCIVELANDLINNEKYKDYFLNKCKISALAYRDNVLAHSMFYHSLTQKIMLYMRNNKSIKYKYVGPFSTEIIDSNDELINKFSYDKIIGFSYDFYEIYILYVLNSHFSKKDKYISKYKWWERK